MTAGFAVQLQTTLRKSSLVGFQFSNQPGQRIALPIKREGDTGWQPAHPLRPGLEATYRWYVERGWL